MQEDRTAIDRGGSECEADTGRVAGRKGTAYTITGTTRHRHKRTNNTQTRRGEKRSQHPGRRQWGKKDLGGGRKNGVTVDSGIGVAVVSSRVMEWREVERVACCLLTTVRSRPSRHSITVHRELAVLCWWQMCSWVGRWLPCQSARRDPVGISVSELSAVSSGAVVCV